LLTVEARLAAFRAATTCLAILSQVSTRYASCPTEAFSAPADTLENNERGANDDGDGGEKPTADHHEIALSFCG
jgi:hypothetical protein